MSALHDEAVTSGDVPLTSRDNFPHDRATRLWNARIEYVHEATEANRKIYAEAKSWFGGDVWSWPGAEKMVSEQLRVSVNVWHDIVTTLLSFLTTNDPRVLVSTTKGEEYADTAKAAEQLAQYTFREQGYREEVKKALMEALLRNRSHIYFGWESDSWLPSIRWCSDEVYVDPDASGDLKNATWVAERCVLRLDALLEDPEISDEIKAALKGNTQIHHNARSDSGTGADAIRGDDDKKPWDGQPGFTKVVTYRVYSKDGLLPGKLPTPDGYGPQENDPAWLDAYRGGASEDDTAHPEPKPVDPIDALGRRVQILLVKGFDKVVKVTEWPCDFFSAKEFPFVRLQFTFLPDTADGVAKFKILSPLFKAKNGIMSFAFMDARFSAQRRIGIDRSVVKEQVDVDKIVSGSHLEAYDKQGPGGIQVDEFTAKNPQHLALMPEIDQTIDRGSGVNEAIRGQSGQVEKTKGEAMLLHDQAEASLAYLIDPLGSFNETLARYTVMSQQRYVRRETVWTPCPVCGVECPECAGAGCDECCKVGKIKGPGVVPDPTTLGAMKPCPGCSPKTPQTPPAPVAAGAPPQGPAPVVPGTGIAPDAKKGAPLRKGADYWLEAKYAAAWRDDVSLDQIRAEVVVSIEPGSTRRDYRERRVGLLNQLRDRLGPQYQEMGYLRSLRLLDREIVLATELPNAEMFLPTDDEFGVAKQRVEAMQQAQMQPPGPPPEAVAAQQQAAQQDAAAKQAESQAKMALEERKVAIEEARVQAEIAAKQAPVAPSVLDTARADGERAKIAHEERRLALEEAGAVDATAKFTAVIQPLADMVASMQQAQAQAAAVQAQATAALAQVAQTLAATAQSVSTGSGVEENRAMHEQTQQALAALGKILTAPVKVERDASGKVIGAQRDLGGAAA